MDNRDELKRRRQAIRLWLTGTPPQEILRRVQRSRAWWSKWRKRFRLKGWRGLRSRSRRPRHQAGAYSRRIVRWIVQTRRRLARQRVGLSGPRAIQRELRQAGLGKRTPSLATIKRILHAQGLSTPVVEPAPAYCPTPQTTLSGVLHAIDWTCRYLEHGPKVYAFHTLNLRTRVCSQTIASDKNSATLRAHVLNSWKTLGIPHFLQLDNDAVFNGGYKAPRIFGQFVRLCLYLGIELIFLPVAEPERNGDIEQLNGLWGHAFFDKRRFGSVRHVQRASPEFVQWYLTRYAPPKLGNQTPQQAQRAEERCRLTQCQVNALPEPLSITAGRIHFLRKVSGDGTIMLLNESWQVHRRLAGKYVWATVTTHLRRLDIWYGRSAQHDWRLLKSFAYDISETVARLNPQFARH
jgi:putative transposase